MLKEVIAVGLLWAVGIYLGALLVTIGVTEKQCLELGYPDVSVTWDLQGYCESPFSSLGDTTPKVIPTK